MVYDQSTHHSRGTCHQEGLRGQRRLFVTILITSLVQQHPPSEEQGTTTPMMMLGEEFDQCRSSVNKKCAKVKKNGAVDDRRKNNSGRPVRFGVQHTDFIVNEIEKCRNQKPHPCIASGPMILKAMIKSKRFVVTQWKKTAGFVRATPEAETEAQRRVYEAVS